MWDRFDADKHDILWYYRSLVRAFQSTGTNGMVGELERIVSNLEVRLDGLERAPGHDGVQRRGVPQTGDPGVPRKSLLHDPSHALGHRAGHDLKWNVPVASDAGLAGRTGRGDRIMELQQVNGVAPQPAEARFT